MNETRAMEIEAWPLAARIASGFSSNGWQVVVAEPGTEPNTADALVDELRSLIDGAVRRVSIEHVSDLIGASNAKRHDILVASLQARWTDEDWRRVDMQRSRLMRKGMAVLIVDASNAATMVGSAPNLWSWVGGEVWEIRAEVDG